MSSGSLSQSLGNQSSNEKACCPRSYLIFDNLSASELNLDLHKSWFSVQSSFHSSIQSSQEGILRQGVSIHFLGRPKATTDEKAWVWNLRLLRNPNISTKATLSYYTNPNGSNQGLPWDSSSIPGSERSSGEGIGQYPRASLVAKMVKNPPAMQDTWVQSLGWEDPLEEELETHSSIIAWRILWTGEPGWL